MIVDLNKYSTEDLQKELENRNKQEFLKNVPIELLAQELQNRLRAVINKVYLKHLLNDYTAWNNRQALYKAYDGLSGIANYSYLKEYYNLS